MSFQVGTVTAKVGANTRQFMKAMNEVRKKGAKAALDVADSFERSGRAMTMGVTLPLAGVGAAMVKAASDAEETGTKFNTVFKDIGREAKAASNELVNSFGLSTKNSQELLSSTGDLLTGFGFTQDAALGLSSEVNKLAVDLASFTNFSGGAKGASEALTKALLGERESVKSLGISILEADVQARVLKNTQEGLTFESERQAKAFATLQIAQEQSKNAIGDYARTSQSFANQFRLLKERTGDLAAEMGTILLPAAKDLIASAQRLVKWFRELDDGTKQYIISFAKFAAAVGPTIFLVGKLTTSIKTLNTVMKANPYLAIAAGVAVLTQWFITANREVSRLNSSVQEALGMNVTGDTQSLETLNQAIVNQVKLIEDRRDQLEAMAGEGNKIVEQTLAPLLETLDTLTKMRDEAARLQVQGIIDEKEEENSDNLATSLNTLAGSITRVKVAASIPTERIFDPTDEAMARVMAEEYQKFQNVFYDILTTSDTFGQKIPLNTQKVSNAMSVAKDIANNFTNAFGQGMANVVVQGEKLVDVLKNIGKLLLSSAIQKGLSILLTGGLGGSGFFGKGGGLFGKLFGVAKQTSHAGGVVSGIGEQMVRVRSGEGIFTKRQMAAMGNMQSAPSIDSNGISMAFEKALERRLAKLSPDDFYILSEKGRLGL